MNPLEFLGSKLDEDPHKFIDEIVKITQVMEVNGVEFAELASYSLKGSHTSSFSNRKIAGSPE